MTVRPEQPEPFLRGAPYPAFGDVWYPRANPTDVFRMPSDVWSFAVVPVGVRLELVGDAEAIEISYRTTNGNLGYRGDAAGVTFEVWRNGHQVCSEQAVLGDGTVRLALGTAPDEKRATVYLPEGMHPEILSIGAVGGSIDPAPPLPRWIAYGDSSTQGWIASRPSRAWASIAARKNGLDLVNMAYASAARGEIVTAEQIAALEADVVSVAYGVNCWTRMPMTTGMLRENHIGFLTMLRTGHPETPIVVMSPIVRPDAEETPNKLGATLGDLRTAMEEATQGLVDAGDEHLHLVRGLDVVLASHLEDGIHPGDEAHKRIAAEMGKAILRSISERPEAVVEPIEATTPPEAADGAPSAPAGMSFGSGAGFRSLRDGLR